MDIVQVIPLDQIAPSPHQHRQDFSKLKQIAKTMLQRGQDNPIWVEKLAQPVTAVYKSVTLPTGDTKDLTITAHYRLIDGDTRTRARWYMGASSINAVIKKGLSELEKAILTASGNLARQQPNPIEEANAYKTLLDMGQTAVQIAASCGVIQRRVNDRLSLLDLHESIQHLVKIKQFNLTRAVQLSTLRPDHQQVMLYFFTQNDHIMTDSLWDERLKKQQEAQAKESQLGLFALGAIPANREEKITLKQPIRVKRPLTVADMRVYVPFMLNLSTEWQPLDPARAKTAEALAAQYAPIVKDIMIRELGQPGTATGKVLGYLKTAVNATTSELMKFCHLSKRALLPVLSTLIENNLIMSLRTGRGFRYQLREG